MKKIVSMLFLLIAFGSQAQIDKEALSLKISKAEDANIEGLKAYLWKRKSDVSVDGVKKLTTVTEFSFNAEGKLEAKMVDAQSDVKQKR